MYGRAKALELWERGRLRAPVDLRSLVKELGLEVVSFPLPDRVKEVIIARTIAVHPALSRRWFRWCVAHAIGHHILHVGPSFYLESWQWVTRAKGERQAEEFAAWLMAGPAGGHRTAAELGIPSEKLELVRSVVTRPS